MPVTPMIASMRAVSAPVLAVALSALAACGGGGGDSGTPGAGTAVNPSTGTTLASGGYWVRAFSITAGTTDHVLRYYYSDGVADPAGRTPYYDVREAQVGGQPAAVLYDTVQFVSAKGWEAPLDGNTPNFSGPNGAYDYNHGYVGQSTSEDLDVSGKTVASVVQQAQDLTANTVSSLAGVDAAALTGTMPTGAKIRKITSTDISTPVGYRVSDGVVGNGVTTLAGMVAAYPPLANGASPTLANTVSMGNLHGTAACGATFCAQERLRATFGTGGTASLYLCDLNTSSGAISNCTAQGSANYQSSTAVDGATPILSFSGLPAAASGQTFTRVFVQRAGHVYHGWQDKPGSSTQTRLNRFAFQALAAALGIPSPAIPDHPTAFGGTWAVNYAGGDTGSCAGLSINAPGHVIGTCTSTGVGGSFIVSGSVATSGGLSVGSTSSDASFTGTLGTSAGSGTWARPSAQATGTWSASKL